ncbi:hypothetical protein EB796_010074 [Bugula neritina]|uniref:Galectin n=1 Tax=Bugula neritina TaxID=10212 RepID=A0A7J7JZ04_BUGNE|nr:hypothetical protein EB796_010074 [Bugula neritina]
MLVICFGCVLSLIFKALIYSLLTAFNYFKSTVEPFKGASYGQQAYPVIGGLWPGRMMRITGMPTPTANRFVIGLQTTDDIRRADIIFHMDVRFLWGGDSMVVLRNSR